MLLCCDWYFIPLYTNWKLPSIFVIVLHREFLFPLPTTCLQTSCPAALWPLRKRANPQKNSYVYAKVIAKCISPETSTKGTTELLFIKVHTELEVVEECTCRSDDTQSTGRFKRPFEGIVSPHATVLTRSPNINFQTPLLRMSQFTSNNNNSYRKIID